MSSQAAEAVGRTVKHREKLLAANWLATPHLDREVADLSLRLALTGLLTGEPTEDPPGTHRRAAALRCQRSTTNRLLPTSHQPKHPR